jgi:hypothetical protein
MTEPVPPAAPEWVHFPHIRKALEALGLVGNHLVAFRADPLAPKGVQFSERGWKMYRRSDADAYIAHVAAKHGLTAPASSAGGPDAQR